MMNIKDELLEFFNNNDFSVEEFETYTDGRTILSVQQTSPAGEDWHMTFEAGDCTYGELIDSVKEIAYNFDAEDEAAEWIPMRGENGVPNSIQVLLDDAKWKKETLDDLAHKIKTAFEEKEEENFQEFSFTENYSYTIKDWYCKEYPNDELGSDLNDVTFKDIYESFGQKDIYDVLGVGDSIVRERIFERLEKLTGLDYDVFYNAMCDNKSLPDIDTLGDNKYYLDPPLFELRDPKIGYSYPNRFGYIEYETDFCDFNKFFKRAELGDSFYKVTGDKYKDLSETKEDYPNAYCEVHIRLYEDKNIDYNITLKNGFTNDNNMEPSKKVCLTSAEQDVLYETICDALERTGRDIDKDLKLAKEARLETNRDDKSR